MLEEGFMLEKGFMLEERLMLEEIGIRWNSITGKKGEGGNDVQILFRINSSPFPVLSQFHAEFTMRIKKSKKIHENTLIITCSEKVPI